MLTPGSSSPPTNAISGHSADFPPLLAAPGGPALGRNLAPLLQDPIDEAVAHRLLPGHETVTVSVLLDPVHALAGVLRQYFVQPVAGFEHLLGVYLHVRRLALE